MGFVYSHRKYTGNLTQDIIDSMYEGEIIINIDTGELKTKDSEGNIKTVSNDDIIKDKLIQGNIISSTDLLNSFFDTERFFIDPNSGKISVTTDDTTDDVHSLILTDTWSDNLRPYEKYTYPIQYDGDDYHINDGGRDIYDNGNYIKIDDVDLAYSNAIYKSAGFLIFKFDSINNIKISGNAGADGSGDILAENNIKVDNTKEIYTSYKVIEHGIGGDPAIHHIVFSNKQVQIHDYSNNTDNDYDFYSFDQAQAVLVIMWTQTDTAWNGGNVTYQDIFHALFG